jgi:uncharacterized damage-inducible protein DinB
LAQERRRFDTLIQDWANGLDASWLEGDLTSYSASPGRELTSPRALLVMHFFNHQTHHPGQVHTQLTDFGIKPGITDLRFGRTFAQAEAGQRLLHLLLATMQFAK